MHRRMTKALMLSSFSAFCRAIDVALTEAQAVIARVAFDELPILPHQRGIAKELFGADDLVIPQSARTVVDAMCGGRGGKSYVLEALRVLHLALTVPLTTLAPGEAAVGLIVAPDMRLARHALRYVAGAVKHPVLAPLVSGEPSAERIVIQRPDGTVSIEALPATAGGSAVRARSLVGACMDEAAFFFDSSHVVNDKHLFQAIRPRIMPGGQVIIASTPWLQSGLLYDLYRDNFGSPKTCIAVHAPTLLMRPEMAQLIDEERQRDPDNAAREFDAVPLPTGAGVFFDPAALELCVSEDTVTPQVGDEKIAAADFGFRVNASTLVLALRRGGVTWLTKVLEMRPEPCRPLVPSEVVDAFGAEMRAFGVDTVISDGHYRESIIEHLTSHGLSMHDAPTGAEGKAKVHLAARTAVAQRQVRIPQRDEVHRRLMRQLKEIVATPVSGGSLSIRSPQWATGEHGDLASSAILAISALGGLPVEHKPDLSDQETRIKMDTAAAWEKERREIRERELDDGLGIGEEWETRFGRIT